MATATKKPEQQKPAQTTAEAMTEIVGKFVRERFADEAALRKDLEDRTNAEVVEYRENIAKMQEAGVNGGLMAQAKDLLEQTEELLQTRRERAATVGDEQEIQRRITVALAFVRTAADPDATLKPNRRAKGSTGPRKAKTPFRAWVDGEEITAASVLASLSNFHWYKVRGGKKSSYSMDEFRSDWRSQTGVDLLSSEHAAKGPLEATCNGRRVALEIVAQGSDTGTDTTA